MTKNKKPTIKAGESPSVKSAAFAADAFAEKGKKASKSISKAQHELGTKYARAQIKAQGIKEKNASAAGAVYEALLRDLLIEHNIVEDTNMRFVIRTRDCPFMEEWKAKGVDASELCESFGKSFVQGLCDGVNQGLRYSVTKMMSEGIQYCEERIELAT